MLFKTCYLKKERKICLSSLTSKSSGFRGVLKVKIKRWRLFYLFNKTVCFSAASVGRTEV